MRKSNFLLGLIVSALLVHTCPVSAVDCTWAVYCCVQGGSETSESCTGTCGGKAMTIYTLDLSSGSNAVGYVSRNCTDITTNPVTDCGLTQEYESQMGACSGGSYTCEDVWWIYYNTWDWSWYDLYVAMDCPEV